MNGQSVLVSGVSRRSGQIPVRDKIKQITEEIFKTRDYFICESPSKSASVNGTLMRDHSRKIVREILADLKAGIIAGPIREENLSDNQMTQEEMAVAVARDMKGVLVLSPKDRRIINTALYVSIKKMVYQVASRYVTTYSDSIDDLAQDCFYRVLAKLSKYEPKKGKFTTWTWHVCRSVLNKKYQAGKKMRGIIVDCVYHSDKEDATNPLENLPEHPFEGVQSHECPGIMAVEIMDAVRSLVSRNPNHRNFIFEIFGNPDSEDFVMPSYVSVSEAAKAVGMEYGRARVFYSSVVRPFMCKQLAGC